MTISIGTDSAQTRIMDAVTIRADSTYDLAGRDALSEAETIQYFAGTNNVLTLTVSGEELTIA